jgi:hypothetical protein
MVGFLVLIELPMRERMLEMIRLPELADKLLPVPGLIVLNLLLLIELPVG